MAERKRIFAVFRQIEGANGTTILVPLKTFAREEDAVEACKAMRDVFNELADGVIHVKGRPVTKMTNLFANLGISKVGFHYYTSEVYEELIHEVRTPLIIQ